jgi:hypothetical protein
MHQSTHESFLLGLFPISDRAGLPTILHALEQLVERPGDASEAANEASIKIAKAEENLDVSVGLGG